MAVITINLSQELLNKGEQLAQRYNVSVEVLIRASVEELVAAPANEFRDALETLLHKNGALYKRLAA